VRGLPRYAARRDNAEGPIVEALEACGFTVEPISKKDVPDLLIGRAGITRVVEVKTDDRAALAWSSALVGRVERQRRDRAPDGRGRRKAVEVLGAARSRKVLCVNATLAYNRGLLSLPTDKLLAELVLVR
jgi:hypothetical protein